VIAAAPLPGGLHAWQGAFGERWFATVCAAAGCSSGTPTPDVNATDFLVQDPHSEVIRVQVKTHLMLNGHHTATASYDLAVESYDRLRNGSTHSYLVFLALYEAFGRWTGHSDRGSIVRAAGYWVEISGLPPTTNTSSITIPVPRANLLTPTSLRKLF
jgi:hypothetical protein